MTNAFGNPRYLRGRPFLVVKTIRRPSDLARTERKGWQEQIGAETLSERPLVVDRVSDRHLREATVIIDLMHVKLVKNRFDAPEDEIVNHFLERFKDEVSQGMTLWLRNRAGAAMLREQAEPAAEPA